MEKWQDPNTLTIWIGVVIVLTGGLLAALLIYYKIFIKKTMESQAKIFDVKMEYQQSLSNASVSIMERERNRISLEIHDGLINKLNAILFASQSKQTKFDIADLVTTCIDEARKLSHELHPPMLKLLSINDLIDQLFIPLEEKVMANRYVLNPHNLNMNTEQKLHLLRIIQECINNIIKHANASLIECKLRISSNIVFLSIADNGVGFDNIPNQYGLGFQNIALRSQLLKGDFKIKKNLPNGFKIQLWFIRNNQN